MTVHTVHVRIMVSFFFTYNDKFVFFHIFMIIDHESCLSFKYMYDTVCPYYENYIISHNYYC